MESLDWLRRIFKVLFTANRLEVKTPVFNSLTMEYLGKAGWPRIFLPLSSCLSPTET